MANRLTFVCVHILREGKCLREEQERMIVKGPEVHSVLEKRRCWWRWFDEGKKWIQTQIEKYIFQTYQRNPNPVSRAPSPASCLALFLPWFCLQSAQTKQKWKRIADLSIHDLYLSSPLHGNIQDFKPR